MSVAMSTCARASQALMSAVAPPSWPVRIGCCTATSDASAASTPGLPPDPATPATIESETGQPYAPARTIPSRTIHAEQ